MRWTRRRTPLEQLSTFNAMMAVLEVPAHLIHLTVTGQVRRRASPYEIYSAA